MKKNRRNDWHICLNFTFIENQSLPEFFSDNFLRNSSTFKSAKLFQMLDTYTYFVKLDFHFIWGIRYEYMYYRMTKYGKVIKSNKTRRALFFVSFFTYIYIIFTYCLIKYQINNITMLFSLIWLQTPSSTPTASLMNCTGLYVTKSIRSDITEKDTGKWKHILIKSLLDSESTLHKTLSKGMYRK